MNAKKCKAIRRWMLHNWRHTAYNIPPLVPVYAPELGLDGKPNGKITVHHFKTATVTLEQCSRKVYRTMKRAYKGVQFV